MSSDGRVTLPQVLNCLEPGGLENGMANVANRLPESEFDVHFCCLEAGGEFVDRLQRAENVVELKRHPGFSIKTVARLVSVIHKVEPDVVHSHNLAPLTYSALATGFGVWKPLLQGEHGVLPGEKGSDKRLKFRGRLYHACKKIHTVSEDLRSWLIGKGHKPSKIVAVVNGVDVERFAPGDRAEARHSSRRGVHWDRRPHGPRQETPCAV